MADEEKKEAPSGSSGKKKGGGKLDKAIWFILFLPVIVFAFAYYGLLRKRHERVSVIALLVAITQVIGVILLMVTDAFGNFAHAIQDYSHISSNWPSLVFPLLILSWMIGSIGGLGMAAWDARQMRLSPQRVELKGNWMYQFKYRLTPWEKAKRKKYVEQLRSGELINEERAPLGITDDKDDPSTIQLVSRYVEELVKHTLITGGTGSGKTISLLSLIYSDIQCGRPVIILDMKRSPELASKVASWCKETNTDFYHFANGDEDTYDIPNSPGQAYYDFLKSGSPTSKADMILGMRSYDTASEVYRTNMQQLLQVVFAMLKFADRKKTKLIQWDDGGVYQLQSAANAAGIFDLIAACEGTPIEKSANELMVQLKGKTQISHALIELEGQMRTIVASEYGKWMKTGHNKGDMNIDLLDMTSRPKSVILFSLNSDSEKEFARYVGSMILSDLRNTSAKRRNKKMNNEVSIYIDEFQTLDTETITDMLEKSRESRMGVTLAQQSLEQIIKSADKNGQAQLNSIIETCSNYIVHSGSASDSAERYAKILGKQSTEVYRSSGDQDTSFLSNNWDNNKTQQVSKSKEDRWKFDANKFMELSAPQKKNGYKATAVVINKSSSDPNMISDGPTARVVWMIPCDEVLKEYYPAFGNMIEEKDRVVLDEEVLTSNNKDLDEVYRNIEEIEDESIYNDEPDEDADGGFEMEVIDDEDEDDFVPVGDSHEEITTSVNKSSKKEEEDDLISGIDLSNMITGFEKSKIEEKIKENDIRNIKKSGIPTRRPQSGIGIPPRNRSTGSSPAPRKPAGIPIPPRSSKITEGSKK